MIIFSIPAMLRFADTTAVDSAAAEPNRGGLGRAVACHPDAVLLANTTRYTHRRRPSSPRTAVDQPPPTPSSVKRVAGRRRRGDRSVGSQRVARPAVAAVVFTSTQPIPSCGSVCGGPHVGPAQTSSATLIEGRQQSAPSSGRPARARRPRTIARVHSTSFPQYCPPGPHCFCAVEWDASYVSEVPRCRCGAAAWLRSFPATSSRLADGRYGAVIQARGDLRAVWRLRAELTSGRPAATLEQATAGGYAPASSSALHGGRTAGSRRGAWESVAKIFTRKFM